MTTKVRNILIHYIQYGEGPDVVLLHGWGQNIAMMQPLGDKILNHRITIIDLPGFGQSEEPKGDYDVPSYAEVLRELLEELHIEKPTLIGHSFGGRVAIVYASKYPVEKLVLFGAPCVRTKKGLSPKEKALKTLKQVPGFQKLGEMAKKHMGSTDYRNASPRMRDILVRVVNQDLSDYATQISVPTLLIWGDSDTAAPVEDARKLEELLTDGALIVLPGCTHYAYLEALPRVSSILEQFL